MSYSRRLLDSSPQTTALQVWWQKGFRAVTAGVLALAGCIVPAFALGQAGTSAEGHRIGERLSVQKDFLVGLDLHLKELSDRGIIANGTADDINREFRRFAERNPKIYDQPGFEYAIPTIKPLEGPARLPISPESDQAASHKVAEIIGAQAVTERNIGEIFRRMFAAKKADGIYFEMFVKERYAVLVKQGHFRKADGTVDKEAVIDSIRRDENTYGILIGELDGMRRDGHIKRVVAAINGLIAYAGRKDLVFRPEQLRRGFVDIESCIGATPDMEPGTYVSSCGRLMNWIGERQQTSAAEFQFYASQTGEAGALRLMAPWDGKYAQEVYGAVFKETQTRANDNFWRDYFKLYAATAKAKDATLRANDSGELLKLEIAVGHAMKLLLCYIQGTPFEGKKVSLSDIQAAHDDAKRLKAVVEATASPATKARDGYGDTMRGYEQVTARAKAAGIK